MAKSACVCLQQSNKKFVLPRIELRSVCPCEMSREPYEAGNRTHANDEKFESGGFRQTDQSLNNVCVKANAHRSGKTKFTQLRIPDVSSRQCPKHLHKVCCFDYPSMVKNPRINSACNQSFAVKFEAQTPPVHQGIFRIDHRCAC